MECELFFYNCSSEYIDSISPDLYSEVIESVSNLPKRQAQTEIDRRLFWIYPRRNDS